MQYKPRELYHSGMVTYRLTGGLWGPKRKLIVRSAMKDGVIYVDGSSIKIPFHFGEKAVFDRSPYPLKVVKA
jgi:hypothetical protein